MNWQSAIGFISTLALLFPILLIVYFRLFKYNHYLAIMIYFGLTVAVNMMSEGIIKIPKNSLRDWAFLNNLLDAPLMLFFLMLFSTSADKTRRMKICIVLIILFEAIVIAFFGLSMKTITIVMGPCLSFTFIVAFFFFIQKVKQSLIHTKALGKAFMVAAITFAYGCFGILYLMHYVLAIDDTKNIFLIYYAVTMIYCAFFSVGLIFENRRLKKREELLQTRKELLMFFSDEKKTIKPKTNDTNWEWKMR